MFTIVRTPLQQAAALYSDAHKDAYGFRPRNGGIHDPSTLEEYNAAIEECALTIAENAVVEQAQEADALARVEAEITAIMSDHGIDRPTAIRWWIAAEGVEPDGEHLSYSFEVEHLLWGRGCLRKAKSFIEEALAA